LQRVPGIARVDVQKVVPLALSATRPKVSLLVRTIDADPGRSLPLVRSMTPPADGSIPIWVSEAVVDLYGAALGQPLALPLSRDRYVVAGVSRDYARQFGSIAIRRDDYTRVTGDRRFTDAAVMLADGTDAASAIERLRAALPDALRPRAEFAEPATIRKLSLAIFDRSFAVTYLLQAVAIAIGLAGVAATFSAQTLARAKEFGMLRHIGVLKRQITGELASEGALLGVLGAAAGGVLGLAMSQVLIHVVNPQSFHWTMDTRVPWATLAMVGGALIVASAGTAVFSGRRALTQDAVLAVREDW
jgi:putative ABC transport system permease protein